MLPGSPTSAPRTATACDRMPSGRLAFTEIAWPGCADQSTTASPDGRHERGFVGRHLLRRYPVIGMSSTPSKHPLLVRPDSVVMTRAERLEWRARLVDQALAAGRRHPVSKPLTIELVPAPCWWMNLRAILPGAEWDALRLAVGEVAGSCCEVCGGVGPRHPVEAHEVWEWSQESSVQRLLRLVALCPPCHVVKHAGRAQLLGFE